VAVNDLPPEKLPPVPTLSLEGKIPGALIHRYEQLFEQSVFIPCQSFIAQTPSLIMLS
jgi:hypothetical protein